MLTKYNNIIGSITSPMLTGSMVGVTAAEMMAMTTMASLHCCDSTFGWTRPMEVRIKMINGNSKNKPIQTIRPVTKPKYSLEVQNCLISVKPTIQGIATGNKK